MPGVNDLTPGLYISDDRWKADGPFIKGTAIVPNARYAIFEGGDVKPDVMKSRVRIPGSQRIAVALDRGQPYSGPFSLSEVDAPYLARTGNLTDKALAHLREYLVNPMEIPHDIEPRELVLRGQDIFSPFMEGFNLRNCKQIIG